MQLRLSARVLATAGALALVTVLSSCGFDYATDRDYTPAAGVNDRSTDVDVLGAAIVSAQEGSGTFVASFANNSLDETLTVESLEVATLDEGNRAGEPLEVDDFEPIEVPAHGLVNLADEGGIVVTGDLAAGEFVHVRIGFGDGATAELDVPVSPSCDEWAGLDKSGDASAVTGDQADQCKIEAPEVEH